MKGEHPTARTQNRRRAFAVTTSLQYRFVVMTLIYGFIIVCFFVIAVFTPDVVEMQNKSLDLEIRGAAASRVLIKHAWVWPAVFLLLCALALHSFRTFQRVAGPLYRFRWAFEQLENGNLLFTVKTRKRDYLHAEEEALNRTIKALAGKLGNVKEATDEAFKSIAEVEQTVNKGNEWSKTQIALLHTHREHLERLAIAVQFFRLQDEEPKTASSEQDA
jgi:hypothetical protein